MGADHQGGHGAKRLGQLTLVAAHCQLRTYWLTQQRTTIGRRASNMLVLDDLTVSGEHALLIVNETEAIVQDLGSRNGTLLNGMPIARALLNDGDTIDIGVYRLIYYRNPVQNDTGAGDDLPHAGQAGYSGQPGQAGHRGQPGQRDQTGHQGPWGQADQAGRQSLPGQHGQPGQSGQPGPLPGANPDRPGAIPPPGQAPFRELGPGGFSSNASQGRRPDGETNHLISPEQLPPLMWLGPTGSADYLAGLSQLGRAPAPDGEAGQDRSPGRHALPPLTADGGVGQDGGARPNALPPLSPDASQPSASSSTPGEGFRPYPPLGGDPAGGFGGFVEGFASAPQLPPRPLPPATPPRIRERQPLGQPKDYEGVSLRFLGGHDAGRLLMIDRPIVSIRNGSGQVAVVTRRANGFYLTHVEGHSYPLVNGESVGLGAHLLRNHDLIELAGTIIQFCQQPSAPSS